MQTEHTIEIKKIITGGSGLGHIEDGMVIMTPFVLPGEVVKVAETKRYTGHILATPIQVEQPSDDRCPPFCPHFGLCGGCSFQHTPYSNQLRIKHEIVTETLERGHLLPIEEIEPTIPSPQSKGYRCKIRLHIDRNGTMGFHKSGSNDIVRIEHCHLAAPVLNDALQDLLQTGRLPELAAFICQIELNCSPADGSVTAIFQQRSDKQPSSQLIESLLKNSRLESVACAKKRQVTFFPKQAVLEQHFSSGEQKYTLQWDSRCFFQVNPEQNEQLVELACAKAGAVTGRTVLDLFCGMGNFSIPLAMTGAEVTGVEVSKHSVTAARENARNAGIQNIRFLASDVSRYLKNAVEKKIRFDLILLDPPRQGLGKATRFLPALEADRILYISCDPATLTRDLKVLIKAGYNLTSVTPVDMFPQTHHIECLAVLEKN